MPEPLWKIERLRELLSQQEAEAMQSQYSQPSPKVVIEKPKVEDKPEPPTLQKPSNGDKRPKSIEGLTLGEILLLQADGGLDPEAEGWLSLKSIPNPDNSMRMPNLKALMRRAQRKSENS